MMWYPTTVSIANIPSVLAIVYSVWCEIILPAREIEIVIAAKRCFLTSQGRNEVQVKSRQDSVSRTRLWSADVMLLDSVM